jgi:ABC-2 type transport system permease protein
MAHTLERPRGVELLHYRGWRGPLAGTGHAGVVVFLVVQSALLALMVLTPGYPFVRLALGAIFVALWGLVVYARGWPIARASIGLLARRWLFWIVFGLAMLAFLLFFFGQYLMVWATEQLGTEVRVGGFGRADPRFLIDVFARGLKMNGSAETYRNYISFESWPVMIMLALAGSLLIGNDLRFGSLPFFLSKPISRWDYVLGKGLAVAFVINLITTVPALALWLEYGIIKQDDYFLDQLVKNAHLLVGILGYGMVLTVSLTTLLLATATWLRKTVPLIMTWTTLFVFCRLLGDALVRLGLDHRWRLIDLWNCTYLVGNACLGIDSSKIQPSPQPEWYEAALVLTGVCIACLTYLTLRIRAVEIVR